MPVEPKATGFIVNVTEPASLSRVVEVFWQEPDGTERSLTVCCQRSKDGQWSVPKMDADLGPVTRENWAYRRRAVDLAFQTYEERFQ